MEVIVAPKRSLELLSQQEVARLRDTGGNGLTELFRRCALAVLNSNGRTDDAKQVFETYADFDIELLQQDRGLKLRVVNAPEHAFVDGKMIRGLREHLFAVLRDVLYSHIEIERSPRFDLDDSDGVTNAVFHILRHAGALRSGVEPNIVVCWGGHSISREEYDYSKSVGHELGLRELNVCTGCGPGAMKGPMKGTAVGHGKQRVQDGRYIGLTEPGIIAAESPNAIVNELVILPDIEKRLEAFVRCGHGFVVFPGGVGTAEEIMYLLGILLHEENADLPFPLVFTGPESSAPYFEQVDAFVAAALGPQATRRYEIILGEPRTVARRMRDGMAEVAEYRRHRNDAYFYNWRVTIDSTFQIPFSVSHESMAALQLDRAQPPHLLAANLRRAFSGIVTGNVKDEGIRMVEQGGPFVMKGDKEVIEPLDALLAAFAHQQRMKLPVAEYVPCYRVA